MHNLTWDVAKRTDLYNVIFLDGLERALLLAFGKMAAYIASITDTTPFLRC